MMSNVTVMAKKQPKCPKCGLPLNKDGKHNGNYLSPCVQQQTDPNNFIDSQSMTDYNSEERIMPGWYYNTVQ